MFNKLKIVPLEGEIIVKQNQIYNPHIYLQTHSYTRTLNSYHLMVAIMTK